jgi:hypothetical protein
VDFQLCQQDTGLGISSSPADRSDNEFQLWFDARYPDVAKEGQELLALVRDIDYVTPEKEVALFKEIVRRYKLEGIVLPPQ